MILCSVQNTAVLNLEWTQVRPKITQEFGKNPKMYEQFGLKGHNGQDYGVPSGTPLFAGIDGVVKVKDSREKGYGLHVRIRNKNKCLECVIGHMSRLNVVDGQIISIGDKIGYSGNTGYSTGPHVHEAFRRLKTGKGDVWDWEVADYNNGYFGYFDHKEFLITFKGNFNKSNL